MLRTFFDTILYLCAIALIVGGLVIGTLMGYGIAGIGLLIIGALLEVW